VVAEQFLMLAALHPGRVDLGLGRSLGFTAPVRAALRSTSRGADTFAADVRELASYLDRTAPVTAHPIVPEPIPLLVLATGRGVELAAELGLPVVIGGPVLAEPELDDLLARYRTGFRPSAHGPERPSVVVSADVLIADTEDEARDLALPEAWAMARSRQIGAFPALESIADIKPQTATPRFAEHLAASLARTITGTPTSVGGRIEQLLERTGADELLASGATYDRDAQRASDAALAALFGPTGRPSPA
jgi:luciferase family oxidoreductase group 1